MFLENEIETSGALVVFENVAEGLYWVGYV
jgi:hypothetical protein